MWTRCLGLHSMKARTVVQQCPKRSLLSPAQAGRRPARRSDVTLRAMSVQGSAGSTRGKSALSQRLLRLGGGERFRCIFRHSCASDMSIVYRAFSSRFVVMNFLEAGAVFVATGNNSDPGSHRPRTPHLRTASLDITAAPCITRADGAILGARCALFQPLWLAGGFGELPCPDRPGREGVEDIA